MLEAVLCLCDGTRLRMNASCVFFSSRRRHTRFDCDWSSDVCSSDLGSRTWWPRCARSSRASTDGRRGSAARPSWSRRSSAVAGIPAGSRRSSSALSSSRSAATRRAVTSRRSPRSRASSSTRSSRSESCHNPAPSAPFPSRKGSNLHLNNFIPKADVARGPETPMLELLASFLRSRHDLKATTLRGYAAGVRRFARHHELLRDLTADHVNDYIAGALARRRRFLAHHDGRALTILSAWLAPGPPPPAA